MTGKTKAKQGGHQHNEVTRIKGKSKNKGSRPQSLSDVDFIVNVEGTEQLSCHNIANFEDTIN